MAKLYNVKSNPFAKVNAEEEKSYLKEIFYKQQYYDSLVDLAEDGASRFVLGQRGQGKTATILRLFDDVKARGVMPILIDQYKGFPLQKNANYFIFEMIQALTFSIAQNLLENKDGYKKLTDNQKEQIAFFIEAFYDPECAEECIACAKNIVSRKRWNRIKQFLNKNLGFLNNLISAGVQAGADLIRDRANVDVDFTAVGREYLHGFEIKDFHCLSVSDVVQWEPAKLIKVFKNLRDIAQALGYKSVIIMFDKIDEVQNINADIEKVTTFLNDFLTDNQLLLTDGVSVIVSLWSEVKTALNKKGVRFDKFQDVDIRWRNEELEELLNKRLCYFSIDKSNAVTFESLVPVNNDRQTILELADHSPRALLSLMGHILSEERIVDDGYVKSFSDSALRRGFIMYCKKFDYVSAQPSRTGKGKDVPTWITRLLRMKLTQFQLDKYCDLHNIKKNTGSRHIDTFLKYNLIKDSMYPTDNDEPLYEVSDPRIRYLIVRGETSLDI